MKFLPASVVSLALVAMPVVLRADLTFGATVVRSTTKPLQKFIEVGFPFRNASSETVTIRDIQTNCDCLVASAGQNTYAPGQAGLVVARFAVGDRTGAYQRSVTVTTDKSPNPQRLTVQIEVPELANVQPRVHDWNSGDPATERTAEIVVNEEIQITFTDVLVSSDAFRARLETVEAGRRYRVHFAPRATTEAASAAVRVIGTANSGERIVVSAYVNVR